MRNDWIWTPKLRDYLFTQVCCSSSPNHLDNSGGSGVFGAFLFSSLFFPGEVVSFPVIFSISST